MQRRRCAFWSSRTREIAEFVRKRLTEHGYAVDVATYVVTADQEVLRYRGYGGTEFVTRRNS